VIVWYSKENRINRTIDKLHIETSVAKSYEIKNNFKKLNKPEMLNFKRR